jgi:hypothetical protein
MCEKQSAKNSKSVLEKPLSLIRFVQISAAPLFWMSLIVEKAHLSSFVNCRNAKVLTFNVCILFLYNKNYIIFPTKFYSLNIISLFGSTAKCFIV